MNNPVIESERLYLREFIMEDASDFFCLNSDPEVMKYIKPPDTNIEVIKGSIRRLQRYYRNNPGLGVWAGFEKQSAQFVGFFELAHLDNTEEIEVGYRLHKKFWNKGFATEMTKVLIEYGFNVIGLDRIVGITHPDNIPSQRVLVKSGLNYIKDGVFYGYLDKYFAIDNTKE